MRLGTVPYARLILGLIICLLLSGLWPAQAQLKLESDLPPVALAHNWQYHWDDSTAQQATPPPLEDGQWGMLELPQAFPIEPQSPILWLSTPLPAGDWRDPTLLFQGIPNLLEAYLNDEVIYTRQQLDLAGQPIHNEGAFPLVGLQAFQPGQTLKLRLFTAQVDILPLGYTGLPRLGEKTALFRELLLQDSPRLMLGFLFLFFGLFPLIVVFLKRTGGTYLAFGSVALMIGIYTITQTQIVRLLFGYGILWTYVHHVTFHLLPVSICVFFERIFGWGPKKIVRRLRQLQLFYVPLVIVLAGSQILTWGQALVPTQLLALVTASVLIMISWSTAAKGNREAKLFTFGFSLFLGCSMYDLVVYLAPELLWRFQLYTWGMLVFLVCLIVILERRFTEAQNHLKAYNKASDRFIPHEFLTLLGKTSIIDVGLGDQVYQEMTVLFSDIRSFTSLSESMTPKRNFNFLNAYLECVSPVIREHNGFIDKYIGDAIMALFPRSAEDAIQAAIAMQQQLATFNETVAHQGYPAINIGIGLHQGSVMLGTIGETQRMETTVIADAVNLASRLEECTKQFGATLLVSQQTLAKLPEPERFEHRFLGQILVKGKQEAVEVCEVYSADSPMLRSLKTKTRDRFEAGIHCFDQGNYAAAQEIFEQLWQENPDDAVVRLCLLRCKAA